MPKLNKECRAKIRSLSKADLEAIVLKMAAKEKAIFDYLRIHYIEKEFGEEEIFEETKADLGFLLVKNYKGFSPELRVAKMLADCNKRINQFAKISKNNELEANLIVYVLDEVLTSSGASLGTCFTAYDNKLGIMVKKLITLVTKKLHPDLKIEYCDKINAYLQQLHRHSNHIDFIYDMPQHI